MTQVPHSQSAPRIVEEESARADFYEFMSGLLAHPPSDLLLNNIGSLDPAEGEIGSAIETLKRLAARADSQSASREFHDLFIGVGRGELMPFGSYYMTGFLNEKPLAKLRQDMMTLRIEREQNVYEPEDNIATLFEIMAGLIRGRFGEPASVAMQRDFFNRHVAPWAHHFFSDLETAKNSVLYAPIGTLGRLFMEIEREAFRMEGVPS
ncbi:MAG: molecular chaperone TorD family protein [Pseudomonadota bacterium]